MRIKDKELFVAWVIVGIIVQLALLASANVVVYDSVLGAKTIGLLPFFIGLLLNGLMFFIIVFPDLYEVEI